VGLIEAILASTLRAPSASKFVPDKFVEPASLLARQRPLPYLVVNQQKTRTWRVSY
jgi:hypothetical protein